MFKSRYRQHIADSEADNGQHLRIEHGASGEVSQEENGHYHKRTNWLAEDQPLSSISDSEPDQGPHWIQGLNKSNNAGKTKWKLF
jgi:hypothetical protein